MVYAGIINVNKMIVLIKIWKMQLWFHANVIGLFHIFVDLPHAHIYRCVRQMKANNLLERWYAS